jgi:prolipoprotein diacylglyceryltransferase
MLLFLIYLVGFVLAYVLALHTARRMWRKLQKIDFLLCLLVAPLSWIFVALILVPGSLVSKEKK